MIKLIGFRLGRFSAMRSGVARRGSVFLGVGLKRRSLDENVNKYLHRRLFGDKPLESTKRFRAVLTINKFNQCSGGSRPLPTTSPVTSSPGYRSCRSPQTRPMSQRRHCVRRFFRAHAWNSKRASSSCDYLHALRDIK